MHVVLLEDLLEASLGKKAVVDVSLVGRVVADALVLVLLDAVGGQTVQDLLLVTSSAIDPLSDDIKHHLLDLC